jgi:hypothetical protein
VSTTALDVGRRPRHRPAPSTRRRRRAALSPPAGGQALLRAPPRGALLGPHCWVSNRQVTGIGAPARAETTRENARLAARSSGSVTLGSTTGMLKPRSDIAGAARAFRCSVWSALQRFCHYRCDTPGAVLRCAHVSSDGRRGECELTSPSAGDPRKPVMRRHPLSLEGPRPTGRSAPHDALGIWASFTAPPWAEDPTGRAPRRRLSRRRHSGSQP